MTDETGYSRVVCVCVLCMWCTVEPHLEAVLPRWDVDGGEVGQVAELSVGVVPQEGQHGQHAVRVDHHLQLIEAGHLERENTRKKNHVFNSQ